YYPQDIERTVERADPHVRPGCGAAFGIEVDDDERLAIVTEVEVDGETLSFEPVLSAIRTAVATHHGLRAHTVVLVPRGEIPKTSSGKIQRARARAMLLAGELTIVEQSVLVPRDV